jgi:elongation factor P
MPVSPATLGDAADYLVEQSTALLLMYGDDVIGVDLPASVELTIAETEPGLQGDRVSGARKPATLETGLVVSVPLFIEQGERVKVDTRSGEYLSRV